MPVVLQNCIKVYIERYLATDRYLIRKYNDSMQKFYLKYSNSMLCPIYGTWHCAYNISLDGEKTVNM